MSKLASVVFLLGLVSCLQAHAGPKCSYDRERLLALDEASFDQDLSGGGQGWRAVANVPGCELAAADLLAAYRKAHPGGSDTLSWHEGQLRAMAGQYTQAIPLLEAARKPAELDPAGWNAYVDATVAFLRGDRAALAKAQAALASVQPAAGMPPLKDGFMELPNEAGGPPIRVRWPPNGDVVEGFVRCFGKPYSQAYGAASCRGPSH